MSDFVQDQGDREEDGDSYTERDVAEVRAAAMPGGDAVQQPESPSQQDYETQKHEGAGFHDHRDRPSGDHPGILGKGDDQGLFAHDAAFLSFVTARLAAASFSRRRWFLGRGFLSNCYLRRRAVAFFAAVFFEALPGRALGGTG